MATTISTQDIVDAKRDIDDIGEAVNEVKIVSPRYGEDFKSLPMIAVEAQNTIGEWESAISLITQEGGVPALAVSDASGVTQQEVNDLTGAPYRVKAGGYSIGERVILENGDIVKSTIAGNTVNPNVDMTGWVNDAELQRIHNKSSATLTDYLLPAEIANSSTTDISAKLQAINDENEISKLRIPSGVWYINSPVVFNRDFAWDFDPDGFLKMGNNGSIVFAGSAVLLGKPTANITSDSKTISIADTSSIDEYDLLCIYNPSAGSFSPQRDNYRTGEFIKVASKTASSFNIFGKTFEDYVASAVDIYKINPIHVSFNMFNVIASNTGSKNPVTFRFCEGLDLSNYDNYGSVSSGIILDRCYNVSIPNNNAKNNSALVGLNYGVTIGNSQNVRLYGGNPLAARHCITTGGNSEICSVPNREIFIEAMSLKSADTVGIAAADFHGNTSHSYYKGCTIDHGAFGGRDITLKNCRVNNRAIDSSCLIFQDLIGGEINIEDVTLVTTRASSSSRAYIDFTLLNDLKEDLVINIKNLKLFGNVSSASPTIRIVSQNDVVITKKIIINIDGYDNRLTGHGAILYVQGGTAQPILPNVEINMSNIRSNQKGVYYVHPTTTVTAETTKLSLPSQYGSQLITTAGEATGRVVGAAISLPYLYPVAPRVLTSLGTDGSWTVDTVFNLKPIDVMTSVNSQSQVRFALVSPSALPAEKTFKVSYEVAT